MSEVIRIGRDSYVNDSGYLMADGWRKIGEDHGSYEHAHLFNINTGACASVCIYDYDDPRNEDEFWKNAIIDSDARLAHARANGIVIPGLMAKVVKGRKVPIGYVGMVTGIRKVYDCYHRWVADYAEFDGGVSTNITNCVLAE